MAEAEQRSGVSRGADRLKSRLSAIPRSLKAAGGAMLLVLIVFFAWLDRPAPIKADPGFKPIFFFPPTGQVSITGGNVKDIRYSFDGETWTQAEGLNVSASDFEDVEYATARLNAEAKDRHTHVAIMYVTRNGSDSPVAEFTYNPKASIDRAGADSGQEELGTVVYANDFQGATGSRIRSGPRRRSSSPTGSGYHSRARRTLRT